MTSAKELFVIRELEAHGRYLSDLYETELIRRKIRLSDELLKQIQNKPFSVDSSKPSLIMEFPSYGRFIEINYHKKKKAIVASAQAKRDIWGINERQKRRKNTNWYSKNTYGSLNRLIGRISWGYTEEIAGSLHDELSKMK